MSLTRRCVNRVLAPEGEIFFFACPKKSIQKKRHPDAAYLLRSTKAGICMLALCLPRQSLMPVRATFCGYLGNHKGLPLRPARSPDHAAGTGQGALQVGCRRGRGLCQKEILRRQRPRGLPLRAIPATHPVGAGLVPAQTIPDACSGNLLWLSGQPQGIALTDMEWKRGKPARI